MIKYFGMYVIKTQIEARVKLNHSLPHHINALYNNLELKQVNKVAQYSKYVNSLTTKNHKQ